MGNPAGSLPYVSFEEFCKKVTQASGGRLELTPHPAGAIVPAMKGFDGVNDGVIDFAPDPSSFWVDKFPAGGMFTYTVNGLSPTELLHWYVQGGGNKLAQKMVEGYNVKILDVPAHLRSAETFMWANKPIKSVADIKGLKFRTGGDDGVMFSRMGASVVMIAPGEIYEAIKRGILDGFQLSSPAADITFAAHEAAKYMYVSPVRQPGELIFQAVNSKKWAELPDDLKLLFESESLATSVRYYMSVLAKDIEAFAFYKKYGTVIEPIPKDVEDELGKQAEIFYNEQAAKSAFYADVLKSWRDFQKLYRSSFPRL